MTIVHRRLTFHAVNHLFKQEHRGPPTWWNPSLRSEDCLSNLRADIRGMNDFRQIIPPKLLNSSLSRIWGKPGQASGISPKKDAAPECAVFLPKHVYAFLPTYHPRRN
jgi:hypothetical protein